LVVGSKLLIKGTGEVGGKLVIIVDNNEFENSIYANDKGTINGNISLNLSIGKHILKFGIMDKANNMSELTSAITLNTRITPVNKLIIKTPLNASKTKDRRVNITGSSDPNSSVTATLVIGKNIITINTKADKNGNWSAKPPRNLAMGNYILTVKAVIAGTTTTQTSGQVKFAVVK
jgi:hypothetical protein